MGQKRVRGKPVHETELKETHRITITPTAWKRLQVVGALLGLSASAVIEKLSRGDRDVWAKVTEND